MSNRKNVAAPVAKDMSVLAMLVRFLATRALPEYYANPYVGKNGASPFLNSHYSKITWGDGKVRTLYAQCCLSTVAFSLKDPANKAALMAACKAAGLLIVPNRHEEGGLCVGGFGIADKDHAIAIEVLRTGQGSKATAKSKAIPASVMFNC